AEGTRRHPAASASVRILHVLRRVTHAPEALGTTARARNPRRFIHPFGVMSAFLSQKVSLDLRLQ
ncbi:MAG: hypothetical protein WCF71_02110, partial [Verrucomicrobiia bacterium]